MKIAQLMERFRQTDDAGARSVGLRQLQHEQEEQEKAESLAARRELVAQRAELQRSMDQELEALRAAERAAQQTLADRRLALEKAERAATWAADAVANAACRYETAIGTVEQALRVGASPRIAQFIRGLHHQTERSHKGFWFRERRLYRGDLIVESNEAEILGRLEAIRTAREAAGRLSLEALSEDELAARLDELLGSLHKIDAQEMRWRSSGGQLGARGA